jgi:hypothetical protein
MGLKMHNSILSGPDGPTGEVVYCEDCYAFAAGVPNEYQITRIRQWADAPLYAVRVTIRWPAEPSDGSVTYRCIVATERDALVADKLARARVESLYGGEPPCITSEVAKISGKIWPLDCSTERVR